MDCGNSVLQTLTLFTETLNQTSSNNPEYFRFATPISSKISSNNSNSGSLPKIG